MAGHRRHALELALVAALAGLLQIPRQRQVQLAALAGQQIVVERLAQERVPEAEAALDVGDQHLLGHRLAQPALQGLTFDAGDRDQRRLVQSAAHRHRPGHLLGRGREALDPDHERVAQALRRRPAAVQPRRQQLLGVQRVALAAREQPLDQRPIGLGAEDVGQRLAELLAIKRLQLDAPRSLEPLQLGHQRAQRMPAMKFVAAVGKEHAETFLAQRVGQEGHERPGGAIGPVHVLQHQQHRRGLAEQVDQLDDGLEQPQLAGHVRAFVARPAVVEAGKDRRQLRPAGGAERLQRRVRFPHQRAQRAQQRGVRELALGLLDPVTAQYQRHRIGLGGETKLELGDQAGLADAAVTAEQYECGPAGGGLLDGELQLGQLADPAHEVTARQSRPHGQSIAGERQDARRGGHAGAAATSRRSGGGPQDGSGP